jgi:hypothetical protein
LVRTNGGAAHAAPPFCIPASTLRLPRRPIATTLPAVLGAVPHVLSHIAAVFTAIPTILDTVADSSSRARARSGGLRLAGGWGTHEGEGGDGDEQSAAHLVISRVWAARYGTAVT